jgi:PAS domain-containing protein
MQMNDLSTADPETIVRFALGACGGGEDEQLSVLDRLPVPVYATDAEGRVTYYNPACVDFTGRQPARHDDRWCVTWKLFTPDGVELPHEECPMAVAIKERRSVRGAEAIAERPDGTRIHFTPFPTPIFDDEGQIVGAVNLLLDSMRGKRARHLKSQAQRCRRLAKGIDDAWTKNTLNILAKDFEERAKSST